MNFFEEIAIFMEKGGNILWLIFFSLLALWFFIIERYYFLKSIYPKVSREQKQKWDKISNKQTWFARNIRRQIVSEVSRELNKFLGAINTLIVLFPLLGLLGTIVGMIAIFDIMAITGTGNARLMASGISMAVIPTMSGMVAAISGIYFSNYFKKRSRFEIQKFQESLTFE